MDETQRSKTKIRRARESFSLKQNVYIELVEHVYEQATIGLYASIFCATMLLLGLYSSSTDSSLLITWYVSLLIVMGMRYILIKQFFNLSHIENIDLWRNLFIVGTVFAGICWGFMASVLLPYNDIMQLTLTILILCGITAGAVPALSGMLGASITFLLLVLLPLIVRLIFSKSNTFLLFDGAVAIYLFYLIMLSFKSHKVTKDSINLQFENSALLTSLSEAKKELEETNQKLKYAAMHDILTGLANRVTFEKYVTNVIKNAETNQKIVGLLYINMDNFKEVNDTYSYEIGSQLLKKIAERILRLLPSRAITARLSDDEVATALECDEDFEVISQLAQLIRNTIAIPLEIENYNIMVTASIGISLFPIDGRDFKTLLRNAEKSMIIAKKAGGNQIHFNSELNIIKTSLAHIFPKS